jgi:hypothetical protein
VRGGNVLKVAPDCIACALTQVLVTAREVSSDEWLHRRVLSEVMSSFPKNFDRTPPELLTGVIAGARKTLGVGDCFSGPRESVTREFAAFAESARAELEGREDRFARLCKFVAAANIVDGLALGRFDVRRVFERALAREFALGDPGALEAEVEGATRIVYLLDNAGETCFDHLLVDELRRRGKEVTCVVRAGGLFHDATVEDLRRAGLDQPHCEVALEELANEASAGGEFRRLYQGADLIIAKGALNYELLAGSSKTIAFLLRVKCDVVARGLGVSRGDLVIVLD